MVSLKEPWGAGARLWLANNRTRYANDLDFSASLVAVTANVNQPKGDKPVAKDAAAQGPERDTALNNASEDE